MSYCLDLNYFHEASKTVILAPVVVCTGAPTVENGIEVYWENILKPAYCNTATSLATVITETQRVFANRPRIDSDAWLNGRYSPTPTIVEAARALYRNHTIDDLTKINDGDDSSSLQQTTDQILEIIRDTEVYHKRSILFLTGVPGAGKTLIGLNVAIQRMKFSEEDERAVFLSGNGPLVEILQQVLHDDAKQRNAEIKAVLRRDRKEKESISPLVLKFFQHALKKTFVQDVMAFRKEYLASLQAARDGVPFKSSVCHVAIFDEAQRAWTKRKFQRKMKEPISEPECLIGQMDANPDWAAIVCLVGGGQEIHDGDAGIAEWLRALNEKYRDWDVYLSDYMNRNPAAFDLYLEDERGERLPVVRDEFAKLQASNRLIIRESLHLKVSQRSFRSEKVSEWADRVVNADAEGARALFGEINGERGVLYPVFLTRDINTAKAKVRSLAKQIDKSHLERYGIVASSYAYRLRADGVMLSVKDTSMPAWILGDESSVDSPYSMEIAVNQIKIQGLEIDYAVVAWEADYRYNRELGKFDTFKYTSGGRGAKWSHINSDTRQDYLRNSYRVILTRARQGMIIYVPKGNPEDVTRLPEFYDGTYQYLKSIGVPEL